MRCHERQRLTFSIFLADCERTARVVPAKQAGEEVRLDLSLVPQRTRWTGTNKARALKRKGLDEKVDKLRIVRAFVCVRRGNALEGRKGEETHQILDGVREQRPRCCFRLLLDRLRVSDEKWATFPYSGR